MTKARCRHQPNEVRVVEAAGIEPLAEAAKPEAK
jgi:hypothetical protein